MSFLTHRLLHKLSQRRKLTNAPFLHLKKLSVSTQLKKLPTTTPHTQSKLPYPQQNVVMHSPHP